MDYYQLQKNLSDANPGKNITYNFDKNCLRSATGMFADGGVNMYHHISYNKVLVTIDSGTPMYYDLLPYHTIDLNLADYKTLLNSYTTTNIPQQNLTVIDQLKKQAADLRAQAANPLNILNQQNLLKQAAAVDDQVTGILNALGNSIGQTLSNVTSLVNNLLSKLKL